MESILPRVAFFYVMQDAGVLRASTASSGGGAATAAAVLLQREVAELWEALSGGGTRAGDRCCDIDRRAQSD